MSTRPAKKRSSKRLSNEEEIEVLESINRAAPKNAIDFKIKSKFKTKKQKELYTKITDNRIVFVAGAAGTGKTYITLMAGLQALKDGIVDQILISKPIVEASQSMGFLPGDMKEKMSPYMFSFWANVSKLVGKTYAKLLQDGELIKEVPLNYMRGNTFGTNDIDGNPRGAFCILDESQNCTVKDMKLFLSRMGEGSKLVIMGDIDQTDLKLGRGELTGLEDAFTILYDIKGIDFVAFSEDDIVRDPLLIDIMKRYKNKDAVRRTVDFENYDTNSSDTTKNLD